MRVASPAVRLLVLVLVGLVVAPWSAHATGWPSLHQQLTDAPAAPGTALARLIAHYQDVSRLDPREASDNLGLAPWLRLLWRASFPAWRYQPSDPSGGYPRVLHEVGEWMTSHPDLRPGTIGIGSTGRDDDERGASLPDSASVGANQRVSDPRFIRAEQDVRIDFWHPDRVIAASNNLSGAGAQAQYSSSDGGTTWSESLLPFFAGDLFHSDPAVDWTSDGAAWSATLGIQLDFSHPQPRLKAIRTRVYRSNDGGRSWAYDSTASARQIDNDKELIWVDHSSTSPFADTLYACWHDGNPAFVARRSSATGKWSKPVQVSGAETLGTAIGCDVKSNSAGDAFVFYPGTGSHTLAVAKSTDGGATWAAPVVVTHTLDSYDIGIPSFKLRRAFIYATGGAYRSATVDQVYVAWIDLKGGAGCSGPQDEPNGRVDSPCTTRIWFARSTDGGAHWQAPIKLQDAATRNDQFNPWLAVDEATGALGVMYYDTAADPGRKRADVYFQTSSDGGSTWSSPVKVTTASTDETRVPGQANSFQFGDYNAMSAWMGRFLPFWTDRRDGGKEQVWTAPVDVP